MNLTHQISVGKSAYHHCSTQNPTTSFFCLHHNHILLISYHFQCYLFRCYCLLFMLIVVFVFPCFSFINEKKFMHSIYVRRTEVSARHIQTCQLHPIVSIVTKTLNRPPLTFYIYFYLLQFSLWHSSKYVYALQANTNPQRRMLNVDVCL